MTAPRPEPPKGYATWLDYHLEGPNSVHDGWRFARAELAELRKERNELRAAVLELGEIKGSLKRDGDGSRYLTVHFGYSKFGVIEAHNALVAKLHAEKGTNPVTAPLYKNNCGCPICGTMHSVNNT